MTAVAAGTRVDAAPAVCRDAVAHEAEAERARQLKAIEESRQDLADAFARIVTALDRGRRPGLALPGRRSSSDALAEVCGVLARALGLVPPPLSAAGASTPRLAIEGLGRKAGFRVRRITLGDDWWVRDQGPLLGFLRATKSPVALVPRGVASYEVVDPQQGRTDLVTPEVATTIGPVAFALYPALGSGRVGLRDLVRLCVQACRRDLVAVLLVGAAGGLLGLAVPVSMAALTNAIIPSADRRQLLNWMLLVLASTAAGGLLQVARAIAMLRVEIRTGCLVQAAVWDRVVNLPLRFFREYSAGALASRAMGFDAIRQIVAGPAMRGLLGGLFSVFNLALLFHYEPYAAAWAAALLVTLVAATLAGAWCQLKLQREVAELRVKASGVVLQLLTGIAKLRVGGAEVRAFGVWARLFSSKRQRVFISRVIGNAVTVVHAMFPIVANVVLFSLLVRTDAHASTRTGDVLAFILAFSACTSAAVSATGGIATLFSILPQYEMTKPILETLPEVGIGQTDPGPLTGAIAADHLVFHYAADGPPILHDVSFTIAPGEYVAFVGPSGSGKSTILRLLLGFEIPQSGAVSFDGFDLRGLDVTAVRRQIGVVLQHGRLMPGDIFSNIVGCTSATLDAAWEAARLVGLDEDIRLMPMGMQTVVTDGGGTLSGGQRQRLMLARAIVGRPRVLLLDEATSSLDNRTQAIVGESLERLKATRIVVAHRLSTIARAHRIFVVQRGRIVQTGTYDDLVAEAGLFRELTQRQVA